MTSEELCDFIWGEVNRIEKLIEETMIDNREHGFVIRQNKGVITTSANITGKKESIALPQDRIGSVHTHKKNYNYFSPEDWQRMIEDGDQIACVGWKADLEGAERNLIDCKKLNPEADFPEEEEALNHLTLAIDMGWQIDRAPKPVPQSMYERYVREWDKFLSLTEGKFQQSCPVPVLTDDSWGRATRR